MSGFEPLCQRVGEEIIRDQVEDLSRRKHACLFFYLPLSVSLHLALCFTFFVSVFPFPSLSLPLSVLPLCTSLRLIHLVCQFVAFLSRAPRVSNCFFMYIYLCMKIPLWWKSQQSLQRFSSHPVPLKSF